MSTMYDWALMDAAKRQGYESPADWLDAMFECEVCAECCLDAPDHTAGLGPFGELHAYCLRPLPVEDDAECEAEAERRLALLHA